MASYLNRLTKLTSDPGASYWLQGAALALHQRDPVDALGDALALLDLARARLGTEDPTPALRELIHDAAGMLRAGKAITLDSPMGRALVHAHAQGGR